MKAAGCLAAIVFFGALLLAFGGLLVLGPHPSEPPVRPKEASATPTPAASPPSESYLPYVARLGRFRRDETAGRFELGFGFIDHQGRTQYLDCAVSRADWKRENERFGYDETELNAELNRRLAVLADQEMERRGLKGMVKLRMHGAGGYEADPAFVEGAEAAEQSRRLAELKVFYAWLDSRFEEHNEAIQADLFRERGFRVQDNKYYLDYRSMAVRNTAILSDCFKALAKAGNGYRARQYLGMFTAFMQEIPYELPPDVVGRKKTNGLWVPTEVLVGHHGDCDSKSVAFAALWRNFDSPVALIEVPQHMLVAVEVKPGPGENYVRIGNRYFVLCEVAGPGKSHPGARSVSGQFKYVLIPPEARPRGL